VAWRGVPLASVLARRVRIARLKNRPPLRIQKKEHRQDCLFYDLNATAGRRQRFNLGQGLPCPNEFLEVLTTGQAGAQQAAPLPTAKPRTTSRATATAHRQDCLPTAARPVLQRLLRGGFCGLWLRLRRQFAGLGQELLQLAFNRRIADVLFLQHALCINRKSMRNRVYAK